MKTCSICPEKHHGRGFCWAHYRAWLYRNNPRRCSYEGCDKPHRGRGYCVTHYQRWYLYGDPAPRPENGMSPAQLEARRATGRMVRARYTPEERSAMISKGNHSRKLKRLGLGKWAT